MLCKVTLVPEFVTLSHKVKPAVKMAINFLLLALLCEDTSKDTDSADPKELLVGTSVLGTTPLTEASMPTLPLGDKALVVAVVGVCSNWATHDQTIFDEFADLLAGVGHGDGGNFCFIHPHTVNTAFEDRGCKTLLETKAGH